MSVHSVSHASHATQHVSAPPPPPKPQAQNNNAPKTDSAPKTEGTGQKVNIKA
jgi:hypothetical protein